jgi:signal transduction histidine kinase
VDTYSLGKQLSSKLATTLSRSQFLQLLTEELPDILSSRAAAIFLPTNQPPPSTSSGTAILQLSRSTGFSVPEWAPLERSGQLITLLSHQLTLSHSQLRKRVVGLSLTEEESLLLASDEIALWLPICFNDELEALLILGPKRADEFYTHKEFEVLHLLTRQAATTLKNIELFQTLESQLFELKIKQEALKKAHQSLLTAREEERKALARELHDRPIQEIIGISMDLWTFSEDAQSESLRSDLQTLRSETLNCLKGLRSTCTNLRPPDLECSGLASAIRTYIEKRADLSKMVELDLMNDAGRLPEQVAISLFRILQEATQNSIKHANPHKILVELSLDETSCTLTITDDGDGFSLPKRLPDLANDEHFGLLGMQERAELIGANLKITSKLGHGTIVFVYVPLPNPSRKEK